MGQNTLFIFTSEQLSRKIDFEYKGWFRTPDKLIDEYGKILGLSGVAIYSYLLRRINKMSICYPSIKKMSEELDTSKDTIIKTIKKLEKYGMLHKKRVARTCNNRYLLIHPNYWKTASMLKKR